LRQLERYSNSVGGMNQGVSGIADAVMTYAKSLAGDAKLDPAELARAVAKGQQQGLLGGIRTSVVGPGVLTETDAARVLQRLGGDINALQNKETVGQAIAEIYQDRYAQYQDDVNFYNESVDSYWGSKGFKRATPTDFNSLFGQPAVNGTATGGPGANAPAAAPAADLAAAARAELERRKNGQR
jgi:hypothetical protein